MNFVRKKDKITKKDEHEALKELGRLADWVMQLKDQESFSNSWILHVLEELTLQCMGKRKISIHGVPMQLFKGDTALKALKLGAEVQGMLNFPNKSLRLIPESPNDQPQEPVSAPIQTDAERTEAVYSILNQSGIFARQEPKNITDVEVIPE